MLRLSRVTPATVAVLQELLGAQTATWGLRIVTSTGRPAGSVYPILARLEEGGWVESHWDGDSARGPRRRLYELTPDGRAGAEQVVADAATSTARTASRALQPGLGTS